MAPCFIGIANMCVRDCYQVISPVVAATIQVNLYCAGKCSKANFNQKLALALSKLVKEC